MAGPNDQDKLSDDWDIDAALEGVTTSPATEEETNDEAMSAEWAAMLDADPVTGEAGAADRVLNQD